MNPETRDTTTSDRLTTVLSYGALLLLGYLVIEIISPFLVPLAWSAVMAIFFSPLYFNLRKRFSPTRAALISTLAVTILLIVPVIMVLLYATREAIDSSAKIQAMVASGASLAPNDAMAWIRTHLPEAVQNVDIIGALRQAAEKIASYMASNFGSLLKNAFSFVMNLFILLFALFFMFRDGEAILRGVRHMIPFEQDLQRKHVERIGRPDLRERGGSAVNCSNSGISRRTGVYFDGAARASVHGGVDRVFFTRSGSGFRAGLVSRGRVASGARALGKGASCTDYLRGSGGTCG